jgi:hypothetical protein
MLEIPFRDCSGWPRSALGDGWLMAVGGLRRDRELMFPHPRPLPRGGVLGVWRGGFRGRGGTVTDRELMFPHPRPLPRCGVLGVWRGGFRGRGGTVTAVAGRRGTGPEGDLSGATDEAGGHTFRVGSLAPHQPHSPPLDGASEKLRDFTVEMCGESASSLRTWVYFQALSTICWESLLLLSYHILCTP